MLAEYARGLFKGYGLTPPPLQALPAEWLSEEQWQRALTQLRPGKSVPNGHPPIASWREDGKTFSVQLAAISQKALCGPEPLVPAGWCTVQLAWLPKPPKPPTKPQRLRSVGLTPGDSKAFLLLLKERLSEQVFLALGDTPQFAYRKGVDASNAILRATSHCREVRALLQRSRQDYAARVAGTQRCRLAGGMMASVDLAKAFDTVPHSEIQCALEELGVDSRLVAVVVRVHTQTQCLIRQAGREAMAEMTRGLRQGCPLAPVLYAAWTARLCRLLDAKLGAGWCVTHASIFADDTLGFWEIRSACDLRKALREFSYMLHILRDLGLDVNLEKSGVLLSLTGTDKRSAYSCMWKDKYQLRVPCVEGSLYIPIVEEIAYLGVILNYAGYEQATLRHRISKANQRFGQLSKVLRTNSSFGPSGRRRVYVACVWSSMRYGLVAAGITQSTYNELVSSLSVHLRKVLRVHEKGVTNLQVLERAGIAPHAELLQAAERLSERLEQDPRTSQAKAREIEQLSENISRLQGIHIKQPTSSLIEIESTPGLGHSCDVCGLSFGAPEGLAMHIKLLNIDMVGFTWTLACPSIGDNFLCLECQYVVYAGVGCMTGAPCASISPVDSAAA